MNDADRFYRCLGLLLFAARRDKDRTVQIVARLSGVSQITINNLENGVTIHDVRKLCAVAKVLGLDPADLLRRAAAATA